jgi:tetraacyldisaccharide 4'-kinase
MARPAKFLDTVRLAGADPVGFRAFPDHHSYADADLRSLRDAAGACGARLLTTAKDAVRLPPAWAEGIAVLAVELVWSDPADPERLLSAVT